MQEDPFMHLPSLAPPVIRRLAQSNSKSECSSAFPEHQGGDSRRGDGEGFQASGYRDCFELTGPAQE
ncbi:MAG TPA: hypothetical protein VNC50_05970, partial [Planctomycetia bacterium]|nr:hypothetical protein [Planctomycetia bacterium]